MPSPAERLERTQWDFFWLPPDTRVVDRPELQLVSCLRPMPYLNTVVRTRAAADRLRGLIVEAEAAFSGRRGRWLVPDTIDRTPLDAALAHAGWAPHDVHDVRLLPVGAWTRRPALATRAVDSIERLRDSIAVADAAFGRPRTWTDDELAYDLRQCTSGTRVHRFVAYDERDRPVATGGLTAFPELELGLLWAGGTAPGARGRGAYLSVLAARVERARALGLRWVGLYAKVDTSGPIVARLGFERHGEMTYWERDVPPPAGS